MLSAVERIADGDQFVGRQHGSAGRASVWAPDVTGSPLQKGPIDRQ